jgi:cleavage and polyadenylation specificity factor subunit 1
VQYYQVALITVDPLQRCAAVVIATDAIAIWNMNVQVNFDTVYVAKDAPKSIASSRPVHSTPPWTIALSEFGVKNIRDIVFLYGFLNPSLLILHEPEPTWAGRTAVSRNSCQLIALSLSLDDGKHYSIGSELVCKGHSA